MERKGLVNKFKRVLQEIKRHNKFLIVSHVNPEGDAIGSQLAFLHLVKMLGKSGCMVNADGVPHRYSFMPGSKKIITHIGKNVKYDAVVFLDCADIKRIGSLSKVVDLSKPKINIDHHISNVNFGNVNLVDAKASSAAEILYALFKYAKVKISKNAAICLYTAILVDTGSFNYANVTFATHQAAAGLISAGINANEIYRKVYEDVPVATTRLLAGVLSTLRLSSDNKIAWMYIDKTTLKKCKANLADEEDFVNFPRIIKGVEVAMLFTEVSPGKIKISFRSNYNVDVNKIASCFGGGGHKKASGCVINSSMKEAQQKVISEVKKHV
ncbi:MAG: bifunctional oligoribonuclease/PAP phosphatase NrnA [Candidatus Omnitrophica bacterium]|nr:bifunctional oligoribonuclease/PAP phosphatase NrnA [Candidatus Omnitrophota bacterium]